MSHREPHLFVPYLRILAAILFSLPLSVAATTWRLEPFATGLAHPWSLAFLPDGSMLVSEVGGTLRRITAQGEVGPPIKETPTPHHAHQAGYFDVLPDRDFVRNRRIYLSFSEGTANANATRVIRAVLDTDRLSDSRTIFTVTPTKDTGAHFGGRLLQLPDNSLLLTTGDGFDYREQAQDPHSQLGKVVRFLPDGSVPADNPWADGKAGDPYVWSLGHRNPQGLARDARTGIIYLHEHGPRGGDEFNVIAPGDNHGWPAITYGLDYTGAYVSPFTKAAGMQQPLHVWTPSIAPSGLALYDGPHFPEWQGDAFVGALVDRVVHRLDLEDGVVIDHEVLFDSIGERIRDLRMGPDGYLYIVPDAAEATIWRVVPAASQDRSRPAG